jgi:preprotein translocase subunit YajC
MTAAFVFAALVLLALIGLAYFLMMTQEEKP